MTAYHDRQWSVPRAPGRLATLTCVFALVLCAGCAIGPDYTRPDAPVMEEWIEARNSALRSEPAELAPVVEAL